MPEDHRGDGVARIILGLGTGRCGTHTLAELLNAQPQASVTHEEYPLLPWRREPGRPGIRERLERFRRARPGARFVGDVASFYLPYAEEAMATDPALRMICLERSREEVVDSFARLLDRVHPLPTDHWSRVPAPGWYHEPFWSRIFPRYEVSDRLEGLRLYCDEYHRTSAELARRFPGQFRVFPIDWLNHETGQREILSFAGIPGPLQVIRPGIRVAEADAVFVHPRRLDPPPADPADPRHCVVLVASASGIAPGCDASLRELERRGYEVRRGESGDPSPDRLRNRMTTAALLDGFHEVLWIGPQVEFAPDDVERLRGRGVPLVAALYPLPGQQALHCRTLPGTPILTFGEGGGLHEVKYAGAGFLLVRRQVLVDMLDRLDLPFCDEAGLQPAIPFFQPRVVACWDGSCWLESDFAFCEGARQCGHRVLADTTVRLWLHDAQRRSWEDVGGAPTRYATYHLNHPS